MNKKDEDDTDHGIIARITIGVIVFAILAFLIKYGVESIVSVRVPLIIIAVVGAAIVIGVKAYKYWRDHHDY